MTIRPSVHEDLPALLDIYAYARQFMRTHGNPNQWNEGYPSTELLQEEIDRGTSYVCLDETGTLVGTFCFIPGEDPTYARIDDGQWLNDAPYHVIHRLATNGRVKGIADACLAWCSERCSNLRVDTHHDNLVMQHILLKHGFQRCGIIYTRNQSPRIAYQRWTGTSLTETEAPQPLTESQP